MVDVLHWVVTLRSVLRVCMVFDRSFGVMRVGSHWIGPVCFWLLMGLGTLYATLLVQGGFFLLM